MEIMEKSWRLNVRYVEWKASRVMLMEESWRLNVNYDAVISFGRSDTSIFLVMCWMLLKAGVTRMEGT